MLNEALKQIRLYHQYSRDDLCKRLKMSRAYLSQLELGKRKAAMKTLDRYSQEFSMPISSIFIVSENLDQAKQGVFKLTDSEIAKTILHWTASINQAKLMIPKRGRND